MNTECGQNSIAVPGDSRNSEGPAQQRYLVYPSHFAGLALSASALFAISHWYRSQSAVIVVSSYGALHSAVTAMTLRQRYAWRRKLLFVVAAAAFSGLSYRVSLSAGHWFGLSTPIEYLVMCAGVGAVAYALLLKRLFMTGLPPRALLLVPLASVLAVLAVFLSGFYVRHIDALAFAWWFAFSAGLWWEDYRRACGRRVQ